MKSERTELYWKAFCAATGCPESRYEVVAFGDSVEMQDELAALVLSGKKRATAGLRCTFTSEDLPRAGDHVMVVDGKRNPVCIYLSTEVRIGPLSSVDAAFAWDEGEGDRSRDWWLAAHTDFFNRETKSLGIAMDADIETVFERFKVIWPSEIAD